MRDAARGHGPVKTHAVLVDPESMTCVWMNETAARGFSPHGELRAGAPVQDAVPIPQGHAIPKALQEVARTGVARHVHAAMVSVSKGTVTAVASIYRLPDGMLLMLTEHTWHGGAATT